MQMIFSLGDSEEKEGFKLPELEDLKLQLAELDKRLLSLRFAVGRLKQNLLDALSPLAAVLVPVVTKAANAAAQLLKTLGQVMAGLLGVQVGQDKVTKSIKRTAAATGSLLKRSLAAFDQINRLQGSGGVSAASGEEGLRLFPTGLTREAQELLAALDNLLEPLRSLELESARWAFERLRDALRELSGAVKEAFIQLWHSLLVPLIQWMAEQLLPALLRTLDGAAQLATELVEVFGASAVRLLEALEPVAAFLGQVLVGVLEKLRQFFLNAANSIYNNGSQIEGVFRALAQALEVFWFFAEPMLEKIRALFSDAFDHIGKVAITAMENALMAIGDLLYALTGLLSSDWEAFWFGMEKMAKHAANAIIGVLNGLLTAVAAGVNALFTALNSISVKIPQWVPTYGGEKFSLNLKAVTAPKIPYLAQGAVLPANKPFLAVVGDQKHGTNIEAPLDTIQQAVALTMEDLAAQNAAGQEATVQVLGQILQAILGISIGDEQLTAAVDRCHGRRAVMRGGY